MNDEELHWAGRNVQTVYTIPTALHSIVHQNKFVVYNWVLPSLLILAKPVRGRRGARRRLCYHRPIFWPWSTAGSTAILATDKSSGRGWPPSRLDRAQMTMAGSSRQCGDCCVDHSQTVWLSVVSILEPESKLQVSYRIMLSYFSLFLSLCPIPGPVLRNSNHLLMLRFASSWLRKNSAGQSSSFQSVVPMNVQCGDRPSTTPTKTSKNQWIRWIKRKLPF